MPTYEFFCPSNGQRVEVYHSITIDLANWGQLCSTAGVDVGETPPDAPIERLIFAPNITTPMGNSKLKEMGFTKLVRRDQGVYENVTATGDEKRYVKSGDPASMPDFKRKVGD